MVTSEMAYAYSRYNLVKNYVYCLGTYLTARELRFMVAKVSL